MNGYNQRLAGWWFIGIARITTGIMWLGETRWKLPWENYGADPTNQLGSGLGYWLKNASDHPTFGWYKAFLDHVVLPNFHLFAFQIWLLETVIGITLVLGLFGRFGGLLGGLMSINLLIALFKIEAWPWPYIFMICLNFIFFFTRAGRFIGIDQWLAPRVEPAARAGRKGAQVLAWLT